MAHPAHGASCPAMYYHGLAMLLPNGDRRLAARMPMGLLQKVVIQFKTTVVPAPVQNKQYHCGANICDAAMRLGRPQACDRWQVLQSLSRQHPQCEGSMWGCKQ